MKLVFKRYGVKQNYPDKIMWERYIDGRYLGFTTCEWYLRILQTKLVAWLNGRHYEVL